jgi:AraC-like DNA-binding protein
MNGTEPVTYRPPASLRGYIEYFWTFRCAEAGLSTIKLFANSRPGIFVQHAGGRCGLRTSSDTPPGACVETPHAFLYGQRTQPGRLVASGPFELTGAVFRPQALEALPDIDATELGNGRVDLEDVLGKGPVNQLMNARAVSARLAVLARYVRAQIVDRREDAIVSESLRLLRSELRTLRIPEVLARLRISERQFERRFRRAVGLSPHQYRRILRFREAVNLLRDRQFARMTDLAADLNYTDQSHFIKEVKALSGYTPTALAETFRTSIQLPCASILSAQPELSLDASRALPAI